MEQNLQLHVSKWKIIPTCCHRNKGEVEYILGNFLKRWDVTCDVTMHTQHVKVKPPGVLFKALNPIGQGLYMTTCA